MMYDENPYIAHWSELIINIYSPKRIRNMEINVKINVNLDDLSVSRIHQIGLVNSTQIIAKQARENAPIDTGKLKQSIWVEGDKGYTNQLWNTINYISINATEARVWSRKVVYALKREFENKRNPHKKFYMKRAYDNAEWIVKEQFEKAVETVIKSLK